MMREMATEKTIIEVQRIAVKIVAVLCLAPLPTQILLPP